MNARNAAHHLSRMAAAGAVLWALGGAAAAQTFTYTGSGTVTPTGAPDSSGNLPVTVINTAYSFTGLSGLWTVVSNFSFNLGTQAGSGSFSFRQGASSLSGTLTTAAAPVASARRQRG